MSSSAGNRLGWYEKQPCTRAAPDALLLAPCSLSKIGWLNAGDKLRVISDKGSQTSAPLLLSASGSVVSGGIGRRMSREFMAGQG